MSIALDLGTHQFRSLRRENDRLVGRSCRSAYSVLPPTELQQRLLEQSQIPYARCEEHFIVMGDAAMEWSQLFHIPAIPLLPGGTLRRDDPPSRQIVACLIDALLPPPHHPGDVCCMTPPAARWEPQNHEWQFVTRVVRLRGYTPIKLGSGMATILAELVEESFTGIAMIFGATCSEVCLAHRGLEIAHSLVPRGGNWLDEQLARIEQRFAWDAQGNRYLDTENVLRRKEAISGSIIRPSNPFENDLANLCRDLVTDVLGTAARRFVEIPAAATLPQPLSVVVGGGTAQIPGFNELLQKTLHKMQFPVKTREPRSVTNAKYAVARGCLIQAELETETRAGRSPAA